jgi:hypothetical protein
MDPVQSDFRYDVFISYSHKDQNWVRNTLLPTLEKHGVTVFIDFRDFEPGAPSIIEMERGVKESRKTILILTPDYIMSAWSEFEAVLAGTLDPAARERRILPILLKKCVLPLRINYLTYLNFTDPTTLDLQWTRLISALGKKPAHIPAKYGEQPRPKKENSMPETPHVNLLNTRKVFMACDDFSTDNRLRALFSDPRLSVFKPGLPEGSNLAERVDLVTAYLLSKRFSKGASLLSVFLTVLWEKTSVEDAVLPRIEEIMRDMGIPITSKKSENYSLEEKPMTISRGNSEQYKEIIAQYRRNLLVVDKQMAKFIDPRSIPPDLEITRTGIIEKIQELEETIISPGAEQAMPAHQSGENITHEDLMRRLDQLEKVIGGQLEDLKVGQAYIYQKIQPADVELLKSIMGEVHQGRIEQGELSRTLDAVRRAMKYIGENGVKINDPKISKALADAHQQSENGSLSLEEKFELTLPIIPLLLDYKISLGGAVDLKAAWREFVERFKKK